MSNNSDTTAKTIIDDSTPAGEKAKDLSELGDEFKGYAPRPEKDQSKDDFEKEELGKHNLSWADFVKTAYYQDRVDMFQPLLTDKTAVSDSKVTSKDAMSSTKDVPDTSAEVGTTPAPEKTILRTENQLVVDADRLRPSGAGVSIALLEPPTPKVVSGFHSSVTVDATEEMRFHKQSANGLEFVPSTNSKDGPIVYMQWLHKQIGVYDGIVVGVGNEYNVSDRTRKTEPSKAGFKMEDYYKTKLRAEAVSEYMELWKRQTAPKNDDGIGMFKRKVNFFGLPAEHRFQTALAKIGERHLYDVRDWHEFNKLWDSEELRLMELDQTIIFERRRIFIDHNFINYDILMDSDKSFVKVIAGLVQDHVNSSLRIATVEDRTAITDLFQIVKHSRVQVNKSVGISNQLMAADGPGALRMLSTVLQLSRWIENDINISLGTPSVPVITGLLHLRIFTPKRIWSDRAILLMDNYLARWLLRSLPDWKGVIAAEEFELAENQLEKMLANPQAWGGNGANLQTLRDFLLGWSNHGVDVPFGLSSINGESVPLMTKNESNSTPFFHREQIAYSAADRAYITSKGRHNYKAVSSYIKFAEYLSAQSKQFRSWRYLADELIQPLSRIVQEVADKGDHLRELIYQFNYAHRFMSLHTLTGDMKEDGHFVRSDRRVSYHVFDPVAFTNIMFTVEPESIENLRFDNTFYRKSLSVHKLLTDVGDALTIGYRYLDPDIWKTSEIITESMKMVDAHPLKDWVVKDLIQKKKIIPFKTFVPRGTLMAQLDAADSFFRALGPAELKYSPNFIFANGNFNGLVSKEPTADKRYRMLLLAKAGDIPRIDVFQLETAIRRGELDKWLTAHPGPVRFDIPVKIVGGDPSSANSVPLNISSSDGAVTISSSGITIGFRDEQGRTRHYADEFRMLTMGQYYVEVAPWNDVSVNYPLESLVHTSEVWSELEFGVDLVYMPTRKMTTKGLNFN